MTALLVITYLRGSAYPTFDPDLPIRFTIADGHVITLNAPNTPSPMYLASTISSASTSNALLSRRSAPGHPLNILYATVR